MGPRSCERGKASALFNSEELIAASMGPRSCERGKVAALVASRGRQRRFNGAAFV